MAGGIRRSSEPVIAGHEPCGNVAAAGSAVSEKEAYKLFDTQTTGKGVFLM